MQQIENNEQQIVYFQEDYTGCIPNSNQKQFDYPDFFMLGCICLFSGIAIGLNGLGIILASMGTASFASAYVSHRSKRRYERPHLYRIVLDKQKKELIYRHEWGDDASENSIECNRIKKMQVFFSEPCFGLALTMEDAQDLIIMLPTQSISEEIRDEIRAMLREDELDRD